MQTQTDHSFLLMFIRFPITICLDSGDESSKPVLLTKKKKKSEKPSYKMFDADDSDSEPVLYDDTNK